MYRPFGLALLLSVCFVDAANAEATHSYFTKDHAIVVGIFDLQFEGITAGISYTF